MEAAPRIIIIIIIAGPNGAGKSTFAREFLPTKAAFPVFVHADLIAAGLAPFAPETPALQAGRLMLEEFKRHFGAPTVSHLKRRFQAEAICAKFGNGKRLAIALS